MDVQAQNPTHRVVRGGAEFALIGRDGVLDAQGVGSSPRLGSGPLADLGARVQAVAGRVRLERALAQSGQGGSFFRLAAGRATTDSARATP